MRVGSLKENRGFVLLMATLVSGLFLVIGMAIFKIAYIELILSSTGRASQRAFAAADSGLECALYWDRKYPVSTEDQSKSAFSTYSNDSFFEHSNSQGIIINDALYPRPQINCANQNIVGVNNNLLLGNDSTDNRSIFRQGGDQTGSLTGGTAGQDTYFSFILPDNSCAKVSVHKTYDSMDPSKLLKTEIFSHGYSSCDLSNPRTVERALQMTLE